MQKEYMPAIGTKIKNYRKSRQLTLEMLAAKINKSKSTLCKYENGSIMIDIQTLYDIADVLEIDIWQLLDIPNADMSDISDGDIFEKVHSFYMYTFDTASKKIISSIIEVFKNESQFTATVFWNLDSYADYTCEMIYHGNCYSYDTTLSFFLRNQWNPIDQIYINLTKPLGNYYYMVGLFTGYSSHPIYPICKKVIVSYRLIKDETLLQSLLSINNTDVHNFQKNNQVAIKEFRE